MKILYYCGKKNFLQWESYLKCSGWWVSICLFKSDASFVSKKKIIFWFLIFLVPLQVFLWSLVITYWCYTKDQLPHPMKLDWMLPPTHWALQFPQFLNVPHITYLTSHACKRFITLGPLLQPLTVDPRSKTSQSHSKGHTRSIPCITIGRWIWWGWRQPTSD